MGRLKIDVYFYAKVKELYSLGYTFTEIARMLGIAQNTLSQHVTKKQGFKEECKQERKEKLKGVIERGLRTLAEGTKVEEYQETTYSTDELGNRIKEVKTVKEIPPNVKAIEVLSRKYDKIFTNKELTQINNTINLEAPASFRELIDYKELTAIDAEFSEIDKDKDKD